MALFKIFKGKDTERLTNPEADGYLPLVDGYAYYDTQTHRFFIDAEQEVTKTVIEDGQEVEVTVEEVRRYPINAYGAEKAYSDEQGNPIISTYARKSELKHGVLTFGNGAYVYDGSEDVNVPVYDGTYETV